MLTMQNFAGINNILPPEQLAKNELTQALNIDLALNGKARRRSGYTTAAAGVNKNVWNANGFRLATVGDDAHLVNEDSDVLYPALGHDRVWYVNLPDGRAAFSNGMINGITDGAGSTTWGVPLPSAIGTAYDTAGGLHPGDYQYATTHVRISDGLEGGPMYSAPVALTGGLTLMGLPILAGHTTNVYLTSHFGGERYYAGSTANSLFAFSGANSDLVMPCRTEFLYPAPVGKLLAHWNGRALVAVGGVLYASRHGQPELFDLRRDFKQFSADITLVQPVDDGIYVGTERELVFLAGNAFDKLKFTQVIDGPVLLGSGTSVDGEQIKAGDGVGAGPAMICVADHMIVAGFGGGNVVRMTEGRYRVSESVTQVWSTFRVIDGVPQYLAAVM